MAQAECTQIQWGKQIKLWHRQWPECTRTTMASTDTLGPINGRHSGHWTRYLSVALQLWSGACSNSSTGIGCGHPRHRASIKHRLFCLANITGEITIGPLCLRSMALNKLNFVGSSLRSHGNLEILISNIRFGQASADSSLATNSSWTIAWANNTQHRVPGTLERVDEVVEWPCQLH